jgi:hypothetical protein
MAPMDGSLAAAAFAPLRPALGGTTTYLMRWSVTRTAAAARSLRAGLMQSCSEHTRRNLESSCCYASDHHSAGDINWDLGLPTHLLQSVIALCAFIGARVARKRATGDLPSESCATRHSNVRRAQNEQGRSPGASDKIQERGRKKTAARGATTISIGVRPTISPSA